MEKNKIALITGASSGIGRDIARELYQKKYHLILCGRKKEALEQLKEEFSNAVEAIFLYDLRKEEECYKLIEEAKKYDVSLLINNAGFGVFGNFVEVDMEKELDMIRTNIMAPQILMKSFLQQFEEKKIEGMIVNICSSAAFVGGPLMAGYYASKAYLYRLTLALQVEEKKRHTKNHLLAVCPGPVKTNFQDVAGVHFTAHAVSSEYIAKKVIKAIEKKKKVLIPTFMMKCGKFLSRFVSDSFASKVAYHFQKKKEKEN